jgi:germination protein M
MKKVFIFVMLSIFIFTISACSLLNGTASEGTQQDDTGTAATEDTGTDIGDTGTDAEGSKDEKDKETETESASNEKTIKVSLFFPTTDNSALRKEEREIRVVDGAILKASVLALADGPKTAGLRNPIPEGTELLGISIKDKVAVVDFSEEFLHTSGLEEITARLSVVNTLTQISGIEKVRLRIEGEDMIGPSGMPLGDMEPAALNADGTPAAGRIMTVTLYFSDSQAEYLVGEKRDVTVNEGEKPEAAVIRELLKGPQTDDLWDAIPEGTKLLSVNTKDGLCTVDFSGEFVDNSPGGTASERMAVYSVVNSLTSLEGVKKVQFLINGKKREIYTHMIFDKPIARDNDIIAK